MHSGNCQHRHGGTLDWTATISPTSSWLTIDSASGQIPGDTTLTTTLTITRTTLADGWTTGTVNLTSSGDNRTVDIRAFKGELTHMYIPGTLKFASAGLGNH